jgi:hypothetical protein
MFSISTKKKKEEDEEEAPDEISRASYRPADHIACKQRASGLASFSFRSGRMHVPLSATIFLK